MGLASFIDSLVALKKSPSDELGEGSQNHHIFLQQSRRIFVLIIVFATIDGSVMVEYSYVIWN